MEAMKLKLLELSDAQALLEFELANKDWFDQFIPPRESGFYSPKGVIQHIREFQLDHQIGELLPLIIVTNSGSIIGRVNVSNMQKRTSPVHLGYRVSHAHTGKGIATWAVGEALKTLSDKGIEKVVAYASPDNPASQKVLISNQFQRVKYVHAFATLHGKEIDCIEYLHNIVPFEEK